MNNYIPFHLHTMLSNPTTIIDSITSYQDYIDRAKECGMQAIAFSEHGNLYNWWNKKCAVEKAGLKYIHAIEAYITYDLSTKTRDNKHCCLIAKNKEGVLELNRMSSKSFNKEDGHYYYNPRITFEELKNTSENIIITTACLGGILNSNNSDWEIEFINFLSQHKDRCFLEIQHHNDSQKKQANYNQKLYNISRQTGIKLIAGTDTHALNQEHLEGRHLLQLRKHISFDEENEWDLTFKTYNELKEAYKKQNALPESVYLEAIDNTNLLNNMVESFTMDTNTKYPRIYKDSEKEFQKKINEAVKNNYHINEIYDRKKINSIIRSEYEVYKKVGCIDFMLLQKYLRDWEHSNGIKCGYGRGSVSGSFIAYLLGITEMDSIKFNLNFFRFLNPSRVTNADVDSDYGKKDRNRVKDFVLKEHMNLKDLKSSEIITFNTIALKGAIRDIGGALNIPLDEINNICKSIEDKDNDLPANVKEEYPELYHYAKLVQGTITSVGTHPSGVLISSLPIEETVGLSYIKDCDNPVSILDMHELDSLMYVKLDILGLDNIRIINETCEMVNIPRLNPDNVNLNDENVWKDIVNDTTLIFQWESESAADYLKRFMSDSIINKMKKTVPNFSMIKWFSFGNGLIRPGCASFRDSVANGEMYDNGLKELNDFLAPEAGHIAMQETIMKFLVKFCGYSDAESDTVRRGIAKKKGTEQLLPEIEKRFVNYTSQNYNVPREKCEKIIKPFLQAILDASSYGFSWNHSDAYSCTGYICGYLRYYYPLEFLTVSLNTFVDKPDKSIKILQYVNKKGIQIESPKFRYSTNDYSCDKSTNTIYKGTFSIKGLNKSTGNTLYSLRNNTYSNFYELIKDILSNGVGMADILTLTQLDYFSEFGKMKKLLKFIDIYKELGGKKTIKKDKEYLVKQVVLKEFCEKETAKQFSGFNSDKCLNYLFDKIPNEDEDVLTKCSNELKYYGYIGSIFEEIDSKIYAVLDVVLRGRNRIVEVQQLKTGKKETLKIKAPEFNSEPFEKGALLKIKYIAKENKYIYDKEIKKCVKSLTTFEDVLKEYDIL